LTPTSAKKKISTPTVLQMEAVECGAAALAIVLAYYGRYVPLEELRVKCGVSRDGSKASNVLKAARSFGLESSGVKAKVEDLYGLTLPVILFWNFNHFLVLEGYDGDRFYLNDPGSGPRSVTNEEFNTAFTGVVLTFKPGESFEPGGSKPSLFASLKSRLEGEGAALGFLVLAGLALMVPGVVSPTFARIFVDDYLIKKMDTWLYPLLIGMGVTALLQGALTAIQQNVLLRLETKLAIGGSGRFFRHVLQLPVQYYTQRFSGDIASRVAINDRVAQLLSGRLAQSFLHLLMIVFYAAMMLHYSPILSAVAFLAAALNFAVLQHGSRTRTDLNRRLQQETGKMIGASINGLQMIESIKSSGAEGDFFSRWAGHQAKVIDAEQDSGRYGQILAVVPGFISAVSTALVLGIGGLEVMSGALTIGTLVAFQSLMAGFMGPVTSMVRLGGTLQKVQGDMTRLDDVLVNPVDPETQRNVEETEGTPLSGQLELRDVSFGFNPLEPPLIEGLNLTLKPGDRVALVGHSGSGRSSVARLVLGLYTPWSGQILFDGRPRAEIPRQTLNDWMGSVDQEVYLFEGTVMDNLTLWDSTVAAEHVVQAAKDACIHEGITSRPRGYHSRVEEGGKNFSGGERQRLEIARALAGNPTLLVLDEATSALDPLTELEIDQNLRRRGCSCLIIAHRLSTIRDCDEIIVLDAGQVAARGTHEELLKAGGIYAELMGAQ
jgi:NHLM bacteriocin system ABC transporter peptidase/ATP-binding protein